MNKKTKKIVPRDNKAYPNDTSELLNHYVEKYHNSHKYQTVSFRDLVFWLKYGERATHYMHSYPGKILPHIVHFFLSAYDIFPSESIVLDPFAGTGTVALESLLSGRKSYYADSNPLARLITSAKVSYIDKTKIDEWYPIIKSQYASTTRYEIPDVINIKYWYNDETITSLAKLKNSIDVLNDSPEKDFLLVTFSSVARKHSHADPRLSVPVMLKDKNKADVIDVVDTFKHQLDNNCRRQMMLQTICDKKIIVVSCVGDDARKLKHPGEWNKVTNKGLLDNQVDLIITSPPYAGAQKYIRATSLNLGWLGLSNSSNLINLDRNTIGTENLRKVEYSNLILTGITSADRKIKNLYKKNPLRATIASLYINEMKIAIGEMKRVLKPNGYIVFIIGNNSICGEVFRTSKYLVDYFLEIGFTLELVMADEIKSRGLMTKRNKTASIITKEWILLLRNG